MDEEEFMASIIKNMNKDELEAFFDSLECSVTGEKSIENNSED